MAVNGVADSTLQLNDAGYTVTLVGFPVNKPDITGTAGETGNTIEVPA
jgi:hypothetical protein